MRNLRSYFSVVFNSPKISDDNLRKFTEVHLTRLATNNPEGALTPLLTATTAAYDAYFGAITDEDTKAAIQKGLTQSMNTTRVDFLRTVRRREGTIRGELGKDSPAYTEFFPLGLTEYNESTLADAEKLMKRFVTLATKHAEVLGQPFVDRFVALKNAFVAARAAQLTMMGEVRSEKTETAQTRDALEDQLMDNLLTLAMRFKRQPELGMAYFDQSIIRPDAVADDDDDDEPQSEPKAA